MERKEIIKELHEMLPAGVDYGNFLAKGFAKGFKHLHEDERFCLMDAAASMLESDVAEITKLKAENERIRQTTVSMLCRTCKKCVTGKEWAYCKYQEFGCDQSKGNPEFLNYEWRGAQKED